MVPQYPLCTKWRPLHNNWSSNPCTEEEEEVMEIPPRRSPVGWMEIEHQFAQSPWAEAAREESCCRTARSTQDTGETLEPGGIRTGELRWTVVLNFLRFHPNAQFFFVAKRSPRKFPCVKVGHFPRSTGPSRNPVLLLPVSTEKTDSFVFALPPRSCFSGKSFFF